jgi:zinc protease
LSSDALSSHFNSYPPGDPRYHSRCQNASNRCARSTLDEVDRYHRELIGTARGEIAIVGDFDEQAIEKELQRLFPGVSRSPYQRVSIASFAASRRSAS